MPVVVRFNGALMSLRNLRWESRTDPDRARYLTETAYVPGPDDPDPERTMLDALKDEYGAAVVILREPDEPEYVNGRIY